MSEIEFKFTLQKIKKELVPYGLKKIMILGGEPFLHPQLKKFCEYAYQLFIGTEVYIDILTNGILLNTLTDNEIQEYKKMVNIIVTSYPGLKTDTIKNNKLVLNQSRLFFIPNAVDNNGKQQLTEECKKQVLPCLFIRDYKVYMCPFAGTIHIYNYYCNKNIPILKSDYIDLYNLTFEKLQTFINEHPHNICKYCANGTPIYWTTNKYIDYNEINAFELFVKDYDKYNELFNGNSTLKKVDKNFINLVQSQASSEQTVKKVNSRINGKLDIIIPYYIRSEQQFKELYETLINQEDIEKYHIYLISDNSPNEIEALKIFNPFNTKLNITHLKNLKRTGPGGARQLGIDNSYNDYIFCLDSDDKLIEKNGLKKSLQIMEKEKLNLLICKTQVIIPEGEIIGEPGMNGHGCIYSREFLKKYNIRYKNYLICEDKDFNFQIHYFNPKMKECDILLYQYNSMAENNLGELTTPIDKILWHSIAFLNNPIFLNNTGFLNASWGLMLSINFLERDIKNFNNEQIKKIIEIGIGCIKIFYDNLSNENKEKLLPPLEEYGDIAKIVYNRVIHGNININKYKEIIKNEIVSNKNKDLLLPLFEPYLKI